MAIYWAMSRLGARIRGVQEVVEVQRTVEAQGIVEA